MIIKQYISIVTFLISLSASVCELGNQELKLVRGQYNFNHPPNVENFSPDVSFINGKGDKTQSAKHLEKGSIVARSLENYSESNHEITEGNLPESNKYEDTSSQNSRSLQTEQIPVPVIYKLNKSLKDDILEPTSSKPILKTRSQRRRQPQRLNSDKNITNKPLQKNAQTAATTEVIVQKSTSIAPSQEKIDSTVLENISTQSSPKKSRQRKPVIPILENENFVFSHSGSFHYSYESGDGTKAFERGELKTSGDKTAGEAVVGGFSYKDKDGNDFSLSYTADENGYRPIGAHLPTPPPIPPAIARALLYLSTKTTSEDVTESFHK